VSSRQQPAWKNVDQFFFVVKIRRGKKAVAIASSPPLSSGSYAVESLNNLSSSVDSKAKRSPLGTVALLCASAVPAALIIFLVLRYAVAIPVLDDWEMVPFVVKAHTGGLALTDLLEQQQEARTFFPKLIFIALSLGKYWDGRIEMMFSILLCCLTSLGVYRLLQRSGLSAGAKAIALLFIVLLIFSPAQHELWLLASGFPSFIPALCVVWGLCVVRSRVSTGAKFSLCALLSLFASFTLSNGLLAWGLTFPVLLAIKEERRWKRWLGFWLLATAACAAFYFWHFRAPTDLPPFAPRKSILDYARYLAAFLGSGLGRSGNENPLGVSIAVGTALLAGYFAALVYFIVRCRDRDYCARFWPWIALGGYSIGSGCLAALGRIEWGVSQALESRYLPFSLYLAASLVVIATEVAGDLRTTGEPAKRRLLVFSAMVFLGVTYLTLVIFCAVSSLPYFSIRSAAARLGASGVLFSEALDTSSAIKAGNYPRPFYVRANAEALDRLHLLRTPLVRTIEISKMRHANADEGAADGWIDGLTTGDNGVRAVWGWAVLTSRNRPADAVVLAYADERGDWIAFAHSGAVSSRPDVARTLRSREKIWSGWHAVFSQSAVPPGGEISAWAVDAKEAKLYRLKSTGRVLNP
jgi:hypothetical protein